MTMYQVLEINKAYDPWCGDGRGYIIYSQPVMCYRIALRLAIMHDEKLPWNKSWVEAIII